MVLATQVKVSAVMGGPSQLQVPLYQRQYEWDLKEWNPLFDDIARLALDRQSSTKESHFLGPIVLATVVGDTPSQKTTFIVDGQQRLLTLTVLLCALRDSGLPLGTGTRGKIDACLRVANWHKVSSPTAALKVLPGPGDRKAFLMIVDEQTHVSKHQATKAHAHFVKRLEALHQKVDKSAPDVTVPQFAAAALNGLECVRISTQPSDNVNRIYETLNNRGRSLTQGDLIRNYVFMRLGVAGKSFYEHTWSDLDTRFSGESLTHLFWLDLVRDSPTITQSQTYSQQSRRLEKLKTNDELKAGIKAIAKRGDLWELIQNPHLEGDLAVRRRLQRLKDWRTTTVHPILMYLLELRSQGRATDKELAKAMQYIESYFVRRMIMGRATDNMNRVLLSAGENLDKAIGKGSKPPRVDVALRTYLSDPQKKWATDEELKRDVAGKAFYHHGKAHQKALVLKWIEMSLSGKHTVPADGLTIEHVMPQTLTDEWIQEIETGLGPGENVSTVHENLVHTLGNLTLATPEAQGGMSNNSFAEKKKYLRSHGSGLKLTAEITGKHNWRPDDIRDRGDRMVARIIKNWPGPKAKP